jgi:DNA excision repair protein ERCC-2
MRIDYSLRELSCSVNDLVYPVSYRRIGAERGEGFRRMWIGQDIHSRRADDRAGSDPNYRSEVGVSCDLEVGGWKISVSGRIDGLSIDRDAKTIVVEEVKSIHFDLELEALQRSGKMQRHLYQLMLYALFLSRSGEYDGFEIHPQLVLIDIVGGEVETLDAPYDETEVEGALIASLETIVEHLEAEHALAIAKRSFAENLGFPFGSLRLHQQEMVDAVAGAVRERETLLVAAPTGVGKTIAALYPALRESLLAGKKLFFLTSKTLQQEMAVETLRLLNDGSFRVLRIRAKQKMCAADEMVCHEDFCRFASRYAEKMTRNNLLERIVGGMSYFDPDDVFEMAKGEEVCPFEVSLELIHQADVIVCDYNYVFDPYVGLRSQQEETDFADSVIVIDEAHNLVDRGRGYYSPVVTERLVERVVMHAAARPTAPLAGVESLAAELREHFAELARALDPATGQRQAICEIDRPLLVEQRIAWEAIVVRYISWKIEQRIVEEEDPVLDFYFALVRFTNLVMEEGEEFAHIVERTADGIAVKIFCKDPSKFLGKVIGSSHATVAISATLEPFEFYRRLLGFPSDRTAELSLPSPFPPENRKIVVVSDVDTTYRERSANYQSIAERVGAMADATPGNVLALFPSYAFLQEVSARLPFCSKQVTVQRTDMTDWERRSLLEMLRRNSIESGHLILAVSGGMYAEGVDYQGEMLAAVFVVGPALPSVTLEQELLKQYYDEMYGAGFEYAYLIPGMTRVIQSAGRVIRSETDRGVIALFCKRFTREQYTRFFPADWFVTSPRELVSKTPADEVRKFFDESRRGQLRLL